MTNEEAIMLLSDYFNWCHDCVDKAHSEGNRRDCDYCMCKATDLAVEALKRQIPMSPILFPNDTSNDTWVYPIYHCPNCREWLVVDRNGRKPRYCTCGQALDWSWSNT